MAIIRKKLGNRSDVIEKKFREHFPDGLGGIRFDSFCMGWKEAWKECSKQLQAKVERLEAKNRNLRSETRLWRKRVDEAAGIVETFEELQAEVTCANEECGGLQEKVERLKRKLKERS